MDKQLKGSVLPKTLHLTMVTWTPISLALFYKPQRGCPPRNEDRLILCACDRTLHDDCAEKCVIDKMENNNLQWFVLLVHVA